MAEYQIFLQLIGDPKDVPMGRSRTKVATYGRTFFSISSQFINVSLLLQASAPDSNYPR